MINELKTSSFGMLDNALSQYQLAINNQKTKILECSNQIENALIKETDLNLENHQKTHILEKKIENLLNEVIQLLQN